MKLNLSVDEVLTTTRTVRKRLDMTKPVPREVLENCLELALQAPNGSNRNDWRWVIVDDRTLISKLAEEYRTALALYPHRPQQTASPRYDQMSDSVQVLAAKLGEAPAILIPLMPGRTEGKADFEQAAMWGSVLPAVWSFFLALRERGLGGALTTAGLIREREIANLLAIPYSLYTQVGLIPVAYTVGTDFKRAWRKPLSSVLSYNAFPAASPQQPG